MPTPFGPFYPNRATIQSGGPPPKPTDDTTPFGQRWFDPGLALVDDEQRAHTVLYDTDGDRCFSEPVRFSDFRADVPEGATIVGHMVEIKPYADNPDAIRTSFIALTKDGETAAGADHSRNNEYWPTAELWLPPYGGESDLWFPSWIPPVSWTRDDVVADGYGVIVGVGNDSHNYVIAYLNAVRITIFVA